MKLWNFEVWESPPKGASIFNIQPAVKYEVKAPCPNSTASTPKVQSAPYQRWPCGQCPGYPGWMPTAEVASVHLAPQMAANTPCQPWWKWRPWGGKGLLDKSWKGSAVFSGDICSDICLSSLRVVFLRSANFKSLRHLIASAMRFDHFWLFRGLSKFTIPA